MELRDRVALHIIVGVPYEHAHFRVVERKYIIDKVTKTNDHIEPQFSEPSVSACRARLHEHTVSVTGPTRALSLSAHGSAPDNAKMWCGNTGEETTYESGSRLSSTLFIC
jgi:hypothetical protein